MPPLAENTKGEKQALSTFHHPLIIGASTALLAMAFGMVTRKDCHGYISHIADIFEEYTCMFLVDPGMLT